MSAHRSKTLPERAQEIFGVTRSELVVATTIFGICTASLLYRWWLNPADPLDLQLNAQIAHVIDSLTVARDSMQRIQSSAFDDSSESDSNHIRPEGFHAPSRYTRKSAPKEPIDVNVADVSVLRRLPGVGPKMAERIVRTREKKAFRRPEDLMLVPGIGPKVFEKIRKHVFVLRSPTAPRR